MPKATSVTLLPINEASEAQRAKSVQDQFGSSFPGVVQYTTDVLFRDLWLRPDLAPRDHSLGTVSAMIAGQTVITGVLLYAVGVLIGAVCGIWIGRRWMSEQAMRELHGTVLGLSFHFLKRASPGPILVGQLYDNGHRMTSRPAWLAQITVFTDFYIFAVGTAISDRPPHRSERAQFGHSAPTLGVSRRSGHLARDEGYAAWGETRPPVSSSAPTPNALSGYADRANGDAVAECADRRDVCGHRVIS